MTQTVKLPDGSAHNFPDEATPDMIASALGVTVGGNIQAANPLQAPQNTQVGAVEDVAKSVGSNVLGGGLDLAMTLPNLLNQAVAGPQLLGRGIADTVSPLLGADPQPRGELWQPFYNSYDVEKMVGTDYEPKTTAGKTAAIPARIVGGLAGAKGLQKAEVGFEKILKDNTSGVLKTKQATSSDIASKANDAYESADKLGGVLKPAVTNKFINEVDSLQRQTAQGKALAGESEFTKTSQVLREFKDQPITLRAAQEIDEELSDRIDGLIDRQTGILNQQGKKILDIQSKFRETIDSASEADVLGGKAGFNSLKEGRRLWSAQARLRDVERIISRAEMSDNPATAIKTGFKNLASNPARMRGFSKNEQDLIRKAAKSGIVSDALKTFGSRLLPLGTAVAGGGFGATATAQATSLASRGAATKMQVNRATKVANTVANRALNPPSTQAPPNFPSLAAPLGVAMLEGPTANRLALPLEELRQKLHGIK